MMKTMGCIVSITLTLFSCGQWASSTHPKDQQETQQQSFIHPDHLLSLSDAEKILGEPAHLTDSASSRKKDVQTYNCSFTANTKDPKTEKTGALYFLLEQYVQVSAAEKKYSFIKNANADHGIETLKNMGDEAYFHTDGQNFYFIMVRKGVNVFNMKVNKLTSTTSLDEFNRIAKKITDAL